MCTEGYKKLYCMEKGGKRKGKECRLREVSLFLFMASVAVEDKIMGHHGGESGKEVHSRSAGGSKEVDARSACGEFALVQRFAGRAAEGRTLM